MSGSVRPGYPAAPSQTRHPVRRSRPAPRHAATAMRRERTRKASERRQLIPGWNYRPFGTRDLPNEPWFTPLPSVTARPSGAPCPRVRGHPGGLARERFAIPTMMLLEHHGLAPRVAPSAYVAPTATAARSGPRRLSQPGLPGTQLALQAATCAVGVLPGVTQSNGQRPRR
jgi:hypothetical protein